MTPARRRWSLWVVIAVVVVLLPWVLWEVSSQGVSPEQRIADAAPPPAPTVDAEITLRRLRDVVVFRGTVVTAEAFPIEAPELGSGVRAIVTALPVGVGDPVKPGQVIAVVSDRPVIVVPMPVPLYRTLQPGDEGDDVARLQTALVGMGYDVEVDGRFGRKSQAAVRQLYETLGFVPVHTRSRVTVPLGEIVGLPSFPAIVSAVHADVGTTLKGPVLSLTAQNLVVEASVDPSLAPLLTPGVEATAGEPGEFRMKVVSNTGRDDSGRAIIRLQPNDPLPLDLLGANLRIEAELAATDGPVLAVPVTAIRSGPDGEFIRVVHDDGSIDNVGIRTGASIGGWVEIAGSDETLAPGTKVRVG